MIKLTYDEVTHEDFAIFSPELLRKDGKPISFNFEDMGLENVWLLDPEKSVGISFGPGKWISVSLEEVQVAFPKFWETIEDEVYMTEAVLAEMRGY